MHDENHGIVALRDLVDNVDKVPQNKDIPLVFVSGFAGWNRPIFDTFNYFGGFTNFQQQLADDGYKVIAVRVGPISSNWERACEIYAQLTAGSFDLPGQTSDTINIEYGQYFTARSQLQQSLATGRRRAFHYGGLPPAWQWSATTPVHFICHSQGGTTVRQLIRLMEQDCSNLHSTYFNEGGRDSWTRSVSTIGTPHNGTTIIDVISNNSPNGWRKLLDEFIASTCFNSPPNRVYDLQLDHWGFLRLNNEPFDTMYTRLSALHGPIDNWVNSGLHGYYDNSVVGVDALNGFCGGGPSANVYFFTMSFKATHRLDRFHLDPQDIATFPWAPNQLIRYIPFVPFGFFDLVSSFIVNSTVDFLMNWGVFGPEGSLNSWVTQVANRQLRQLGFNVSLPNPGTQIPRGDVLPLLVPTAYGMGGYHLTAPQVAILGMSTDDYQPNDGVVNTMSMRGPKNANVQEIGQFPTNNIGSSKGVFWHLGTNETLDHADQVGAFTDINVTGDILTMYNYLAALVTRLPA